MVWTCRLLARLSEQQWRDGFRAAGYDDERTTRYIEKIREKIDQGIALSGAGGTLN